jgi:hypothetical protein
MILSIIEKIKAQYLMRPLTKEVVNEMHYSIVDECYKLASLGYINNLFINSLVYFIEGLIEVNGENIFPEKSYNLRKMLK